MPRLRLDLCRCLVLLTRLFLGNRFRSPLEVLFAELELRHRLATLGSRVLGFEDYGGQSSVSCSGVVDLAVKTARKKRN